MAEGDHPNCQAVEDFLNSIPSISRTISRTERVNDVPQADAYTAAYHDPQTGRGFTVIAYGSDQLLVSVEGYEPAQNNGKRYRNFTGSLSDAAAQGQAFSAFLTS